jgi:serine/threonine protein kinase
VIELLGEGSYGTVFKARDKLVDIYYAIKCIQLPPTDEEKKKVLREVKTHARLGHQHVVRYYVTWLETPQPGIEKLFIAMEYCSGGSLKDWMEKNLDRDRPVCIRIIRQICTGVDYLHRQRFMHRDLKPENIYLTEGLCVKIGDFGLAVRTGIWDTRSGDEHPPGEHTQGAGTPLYMAPEQIYTRYYDHKADIYSLGLIMLELFSAAATEEERIRILHGARLNIYPYPMAQNWKRILHKILGASEEERPEASQILRDFPRATVAR